MMQRESPYPMLAVADAQRIIAAHMQPLGTEVIDVRSGDGDHGNPAAEGRVLAETIHAPGDIPDLPKSAVDGYALRSDDGAVPRRVLAEITAGIAADLTITPGTAARIMTGGALPAGADAVVMVEQTAEQDGILTVQRVPQRGAAVHVVGQDIAVGEVVLSAGTRLGPAEIGLLATIGLTQVRVYRRPLVAVLATGDEVYEPDAPLPAGGVRDSNRYTLLAAAREAGCDVLSLGIAHDDAELQRRKIIEGIERADVLLTSGGVSMGTRDLIKPLLAELGTVHFGRVAFKPGKPTMYATVGGKHVFGLPGYPVSSLVSFEVFVRPALRRLQGDVRPDRPLVRVVLHDAVTASPDRPEYQRAIVGFADGQLVARSTGAQGSSRLLSLRGANALLLIPAGTQRYAPGDMVDALLTGQLA
ncbi:MAG TPA: molybdopterin molybdotransferase MoeA [Roseiflexaceae bacterium]|nr:molybdopterin molybdotransferase MoeA [Roseiflexaceae bacterium]HMP42889.1 molybdopterin molybdotransferase MoeA [Roseiflexaceae bacterium]